MNIKGCNYRCIISLIGKNEAINLMKNAYLTKQKWNIIKHKQFIFIYKNGQKNFNVWQY